MKLYLFKKIVLCLFLFSLSAPILVEAAVTIPNPLCPPGPPCTMTLADIIEKIINFIFSIGVAVFPIMAIIAGFLFLSSGGDPAKVKTAKNILLYSVIGLFVILLARGLISMIQSLLAGS